MSYVNNDYYRVSAGANYTNALDRNYDLIDQREGTQVERHDISDNDFEGNPIADFGIALKDLGVSANPMKDQREALKARIFQGASKVELGFMGQGKGSGGQGQFTPETYGTEERRDIRELARLNKISLTSHAAVHGNSLAGYQQGNFDERQREGTLHEIKKAIDFAADTQTGGAIVFHLTEFPRPVSEFYGDQGFKAYDLEKEKAQFILVDKRTGQAITSTRKDLKVYTPEWETDANGQYKIDENGFKIPKFIPEKWEEKTVNGKTEYVLNPSKVDIRERNWQYFEDEAKKWNAEHPDQPRTAAMMQYFDTQDIQVAQAVAFARLRSSGGGVETLIKEREKLEKALSIYSELEKKTPEDEMWALTQKAGSHLPGLVPGENKRPTELIKDAISQINNTIALDRAGSGYFSQAEEVAARKKYVEPIEKYAIEKTSDTIARAGLHALKRTEYMKGQAFNKGQKIDPLFVAVENAHMPDFWGAHPQELKAAIINSRKKMEDVLAHQGYPKEEAHKLAQEHIKATVDIGHANTWRKFFQGDPNKSIEANDKDFKRWLLGQAEDLVKSGVIGHIHVTDNFGYDDEHLTPGQGNTPIKEFLDKVKKLNVSVIVEPAHQDFGAMLGAWKRYGQSIYGLPTRSTDTWADVEHSYFGRPAPPYFLFGESAPDQESWQLWSQTRLE